ncbi:hypothetical protein CsatB_012914 [Cannabis sativa]
MKSTRFPILFSGMMMKVVLLVYLIINPNIVLTISTSTDINGSSTTTTTTLNTKTDPSSVSINNNTNHNTSLFWSELSSSSSSSGGGEVDKTSLGSLLHGLKCTDFVKDDMVKHVIEHVNADDSIKCTLKTSAEFGACVANKFCDCLALPYPPLFVGCMSVLGLKCTKDALHVHFSPCCTNGNATANATANATTNATTNANATSTDHNLSKYNIIITFLFILQWDIFATNAKTSIPQRYNNSLHKFSSRFTKGKSSPFSVLLGHGIMDYVL